MEEGTTLIYELTFGDNQEKLGSIIFDNATGNLTFLDATSGLESSLEDILSGSKKKALILPDSLPATQTDKQEADKVNFLIGGKHGSNMDTMIVAQVDTVSKTVKMISIPRDLFMDERKLNSYSIDQIKKYLGVVTGLHIDHHMIIDMYAYIEVVDSLGGVDVYLKEPVVDPTYRTVDNGIEGTLNYQVGWHHFSGVQSLRIARSRHTTSDFVRAERQQEILKALKKKIAELNVTDAAQALKIANTILTKLDTDMSLKDIMTYELRFKNFEMEAKGGLSTGNVLTSEMHVSAKAQAAAAAGCPKAEEGAPPIPCATGKAQYILKPAKDWNAVRWYVSELLKE